MYDFPGLQPPLLICHNICLGPLSSLILSSDNLNAMKLRLGLVWWLWRKCSHFLNTHPTVNHRDTFCVFEVKENQQILQIKCRGIIWHHSKPTLYLSEGHWILRYNTLNGDFWDPPLLRLGKEQSVGTWTWTLRLDRPVFWLWPWATFFISQNLFLHLCNGVIHFSQGCCENVVISKNIAGAQMSVPFPYSLGVAITL